MAITHINLGTSANDGTGTKARAAGQIINDNFDEVEANISTNIDISTYVEKAGMSEGNDVSLIRTENIKAYILLPGTYAKRLYSQWLDIINETYFNSIRIAFVRAESAVAFTGGITVRMAINGAWVFRKEITFAELVAYGINTYFPTVNPTDVTDRLYTIKTDQLIVVPGDVVYIAWSCDEAADKLSSVYDNSDFTGTEFAGLYKKTSLTSVVDDYVTVPTKTTEASPNINWVYSPVINLVDYVGLKIEQSGFNKVDEAYVYPAKVYTTCRDIIQTDSGFDSKNYSAVLYVDHLFKLSERKNIFFDDTENDKYELFAPIAIDNTTYNNGVDVNTEVKSIKVVGEAINDINLSISHISTKASTSELLFPKILVIGDSVTGLFLADKPTELTTGKAAGYWQYAKHFFELDKIDNGSGHDALFIGQKNITTFDVNGNAVRAMAEGRGGWSTAKYLYDETYDGNTNAFYDTTKTGVKFSIVKYLEKFKTLADDGITRLVVGSTAGTSVTDVNAYDVCTPNMVVIQLGFNDVESAFITDISLLIAEIKAEYPSMIIILSTIDASGTYFPELYPQYKGVDYLADTLHSKMWNLLDATKALEDVPNKVFYCPNYFVQPTAIARAYRSIDPPENIHKTDAIINTTHGAADHYHPNTFAHAAWGYQLYSLIKYILTL